MLSTSKSMTIPRVTEDVFEKDYFPANRPAIIIDALSSWKAVGLWTHSYLSSTYQDKQVIVSASIEETHKGESPALESGFWIKHVDEEMDFRAAIDLITGTKDTNHHYYLWRRSIPDEYPELYADISIPSWIPIEKPRVNLWVGGANHVTTCHYDLENNFFAQVYGQKHFTIYSPDDTIYLYPHPIHTDIANISSVDIDKPDLNSFPGFSQACAIEGVVGAGDLLYLPSRWWHHVKSLENTISVNFWWPANFDQALVPNDLRRLPMQYQHDRLGQLKSTALEPAGLSLIDLAKLLYERKYYLPAVLAAGATLEEAIRELCRQHRIPDRHNSILRDLGFLNDELEATGVYSEQEASSVRSWNAMVNRALAADNRQYQAVGDTFFEAAEVHALIDNIHLFVKRMEQVATEQIPSGEWGFDIIL
jgi:hypothetical protein